MKEIENDEKFILETASAYSDIPDIIEKVEAYFNKKYAKKLGRIDFSYDDMTGDWVLATPKKTIRSVHLESLPARLAKLL